MSTEEAIHTIETSEIIWARPTEEEYEALTMAIEALKSQTTGKWIIKSNTTPWYTEWWYACSECGQYPLRDRYGQEALSDYCPNCGARMRGEEDG